MARKIGTGEIARQEDLWRVVLFKWFIIDNWQLKVWPVSAVGGREIKIAKLETRKRGEGVGCR